MHAFELTDGQTDRRTEFSYARPRLHSMQRGKNRSVHIGEQYSRNKILPGG